MDPRLLALWTLALSAGACLGWWALVLVRVLRDRPRIPRAPQGLAMPRPDPTPRVSVVIPAHNEQAHAPRAVRSILASDWAALEVIVVLDRCTDGTLAALQPIAAADPRLRLVENHDCPADWAGKCNAARVGAAGASGELLLFTDADVEFHPDLLRASVAILRGTGLSLLSLLASPRVRHWFEAVVQPVAAMMLMRMYPIPRVNHPTNPRAFANGQFLLFERSLYERLGGHAAVKDDLLEDIAFAHKVRAAGGRGGLYTAEHLLTVEMYERMREFHEGWKRIYIEAAERVVGRMQALGLECLGVGALLPLASVLALMAGAAWRGGSLDPLAWVTMWLGAAALGVFVGVTMLLHRMCRAPALGALFHPLGAWLVAHIFLEGARDLALRRPVRWGGRDYVLEPWPEGRYPAPSAAPR
ncbi:MAG: hypothetical protein RLZZ558_1062 [Planctomycetota bacterium]